MWQRVVEFVERLIRLVASRLSASPQPIAIPIRIEDPRKFRRNRTENS